MARNEERVRERLGALGDGPRGGRWDEDDLDYRDGVGHREGGDHRNGRAHRKDGDSRAAADRPPDDVPGQWHEPVDGPRVPHWLSEPAGGVSLWHERLVPERFRGTRLDPGRRGVLALAALGIVAIIAAAVAVQRETPVAQPVPPLPAVRAAGVSSSPSAPSPGSPSAPVPPPATSTASAAERPPELVVSVVGRVEHAGLLHLAPGSRVADAVAAARTREGADLAGLNLAQRLGDGDQVVVGVVAVADAHPGPPQLPSMVLSGGDRPAARDPVTATTSSAPAARVNLNTAGESELDVLPGVGPATARAILTWRTEHGRFSSIDQLAEVTGIGQARLTRLRGLVTL